MQNIVNQNKLHLKGEAVDYLMLALQERVKQIVESLIEISHERLEYAKSHQNTKISSNPGLFIQQIKQRDKEERETTRQIPLEIPKEPSKPFTPRDALELKKLEQIRLEGREWTPTEQLTYNDLYTRSLESKKYLQDKEKYTEMLNALKKHEKETSPTITKKDFLLFASSETDLKTKDFYHYIKMGL